VTVGLSATNLANKWLDVLGNGASAGTTFTALAGTYIKLHTGDPGAAGATAAAAGSTTRVAQGFSAAAAGSKSGTGTAPVWTNGGTSETLSHISAWDASTAGNFIFSAALTASQAWASGNTFTLTSLTVSLTPIAA
jgi:hypothetical protein